MTDNDSTPPPEATSPASGGRQLYAAYDEDEQRFVGPPAVSKAKAKEVANAPKGHKVTVREV